MLIILKRNNETFWQQKVNTCELSAQKLTNKTETFCFSGQTGIFTISFSKVEYFECKQKIIMNLFTKKSLSCYFFPESFLLFQENNEKKIVKKYVSSFLNKNSNIICKKIIVNI